MANPKHLKLVKQGAAPGETEPKVFDWTPLLSAVQPPADTNRRA